MATAPRTLVGRTYPPTEAYEVTRERIREFATAIGDPNPVYRSAEAARAAGQPDVVAPPTFPALITIPAIDLLKADPEFGADWSRLLHGEQGFVHERPLRPGDRVVAALTIADVRPLGSRLALSVRTEISTEEGELVSTGLATLVVARKES
jgi:acyl dehydratase